MERTRPRVEESDNEIEKRTYYLTMRLSIRLYLALLLMFSCSCASAQMSPSDPVALKASLVKFQTQRVEWEKIVRSVRVEELPVSYAEGKNIQLWLDICLATLQQSADVANRSLLSGRLAQVTILDFQLLELEHGLQTASALLDDVVLEAGSIKNKRDGWSKALNDLGTNVGPLDKLYVSTNTFVLSRTDELERACPINDGGKISQ